MAKAQPWSKIKASGAMRKPVNANSGYAQIARTNADVEESVQQMTRRIEEETIAKKLEAGEYVETEKVKKEKKKAKAPAAKKGKATKPVKRVKRARSVLDEDSDNDDDTSTPAKATKRTKLRRKTNKGASDDEDSNSVETFKRTKRARKATKVDSDNEENAEPAEPVKRAKRARKIVDDEEDSDKEVVTRGKPTPTVVIDVDEEPAVTANDVSEVWGPYGGEAFSESKPSTFLGIARLSTWKVKDFKKALQKRLDDEYGGAEDIVEDDFDHGGEFVTDIGAKFRDAAIARMIKEDLQGEVLLGRKLQIRFAEER